MFKHFYGCAGWFSFICIALGIAAKSPEYRVSKQAEGTRRSLRYTV